jgi:hypothetical protein
MRGQSVRASELCVLKLDLDLNKELLRGFFVF